MSTEEARGIPASVILDADGALTEEAIRWIIASMRAKMCAQLKDLRVICGDTIILTYKVHLKPDGITEITE